MLNPLQIKLNQVYVTCKIRYYMHMMSAARYKLYNTIATIPVIVLSTATTLLASFNTNNLLALTITISVMSGITTVCHAVASFLQYSTLYAKHFATANQYISLVQYIETNYFTNQEKIESLSPILLYINKQLINVQNSEPLIPISFSQQTYTSLIYNGIPITQPLIIDVETEQSIQNPSVGRPVRDTAQEQRQDNLLQVVHDDAPIF